MCAFTHPKVVEECHESLTTSNKVCYMISTVDEDGIDESQIRGNREQEMRTPVVAATWARAFDSSLPGHANRWAKRPAILMSATNLELDGINGAAMVAPHCMMHPPSLQQKRNLNFLKLNLLTTFLDCHGNFSKGRDTTITPYCNRFDYLIFLKK